MWLIVSGEGIRFEYLKWEYGQFLPADQVTIKRSAGRNRPYSYSHYEWNIPEPTLHNKNAYRLRHEFTMGAVDGHDKRYYQRETSIR
jgi:hypothetical protein